jgi:hypothetical protein
MGYIHFVRSGGVKQAGKTVLSSMLMEYLRIHQIPAYYIDSLENPKMGLYYSPEQNTGESRIRFDLQDITKADPMVELSIDGEVVVDLPANMEDVANSWIEDIAKLIQSNKIKVIDWFIFSYSVAAWETHLRQAAFWKSLDVDVPQLLILPEHLPRNPCVPADFLKICDENLVAVVFLRAPEGVTLEDKPIREVLDTAQYPRSKPLSDWAVWMFELFKYTQLFQEQERLAPDYSVAKHPLELLAIAKAHLPHQNLQPKKVPDKKIDAPPPAPW